ncbi:MAG: methyltransferase domain-containing protein [Bdellovibrionota bacterium]
MSSAGSRDKWNPDQYHRFQKERSAPFYDLLALVQGTDFESVVDLGCGSGELTQVLHEKLRCQRTLGIDNSEKMLAKAHDYAAGGLSFRSGDLAGFQTDKPLDLIFSNAAIQWCPDHPGIFRRLRDQLKPGGQLAVQMPMNHDYPTHALADALAAEEPYRSALPSPRETSMLPAEGYAKLLFSLGFAQQSVRLQVYPHVLDSREGVIEWVKGTMLTFYEGGLGAELYPRFLSEFRTRLFRALPDEKPFFYPFKRVLIWARR